MMRNATSVAGPDKAPTYGKPSGSTEAAVARRLELDHHFDRPGTRRATPTALTTMTMAPAKSEAAKTPDESLAGRIGEPLALCAPELPGDPERGGQRLLSAGEYLPRHTARRVRKAGAVARVEHAAEDGYSEDAAELAGEVVDRRGHACLPWGNEATMAFVAGAALKAIPAPAKTNPPSTCQ